MSNLRRERFRKIAEKRVNKIFEDFRLLGNCSNKGNYEYTEEEVERIFRAIDKEYAALKKKFSDRGAKKEGFKL
ncbi:MAG: hypothetical protein SOV58_05085 [Candidatus Enteromonas sp.]|nr:hypothetical protein [Candidatus Enteromonas sp.]